MRIGLVYETFADYVPRPGDPPDADAEYEPEATVETLEAAVRKLGHTPVRLGPVRTLADVLARTRVDAAINIAESAGSRNREAHAPVLLELAGVPCVGSDALTLTLSLDKVWTKDLCATVGVPAPAHRVYASPDAIDPADLPPFPLFVKPRYEGTAKGILPESKVTDLDQLRAQVARVTGLYGQDALVEAFVEGSEFTVAVIGHPPEALPVLQRAVEADTGIGLHALDRATVPARDWAYHLPGDLTPALEAELQALTLRVFHKLECRDFARLDFRVTPDGRPFFLEINPLPTFAPDGTFAILAELMGQPYDAWLADVFASAFARLGGVRG